MEGMSQISIVVLKKRKKLIRENNTLTTMLLLPYTKTQLSSSIDISPVRHKRRKIDCDTVIILDVEDKERKTKTIIRAVPDVVITTGEINSTSSIEEQQQEEEDLYGIEDFENNYIADGFVVIDDWDDSEDWDGDFSE